MACRSLIATSLWFFMLLQLAGASNPSDKLNNLLSNPPFGQTRAGATAGNGAGDPFEFRAVLEESGHKLFSIYETGTHHSTWVELNDPVNGFSIKSYNPANESVTVDYQNRPMTLALKRAAPVVQAMPFPSAPNGIAPLPGNLSGQVMPSPMDQQRLQQIQEEIRRRRALRQQAGPPFGLPSSGSGPQVLPSTTGGPQPMPSTLPVPAKP